MKKFARFALVPAATLVLVACGSSESAKEEAQPDNVEILTEEVVGDVDAAATPVADAAAAPGAATPPPAGADTPVSSEDTPASKAAPQ